MKNYIFLIYLLCLLISTQSLALADRSRDWLLLDGTEPLHDFGMDTTGHWWAITKPFSNQFRLIVDGQETDVYRDLSYPVFSPDGNRWACFARDIAQWYLVTDEEAFPIPGTDPGEIVFSPNSMHLVYSYKESGQEYIIWKDKTIRVFQRFGKLYLSWNAERLAFLGYRGTPIPNSSESFSTGGVVVNVNGRESTVYDEVIPFGFWYDGRMVFAGRNGHSWEVYRGNESIGDIYDDVRETAINLEGTVAAFLAVRSGGGSVGVLISDEYYEPLETKVYDGVRNLALHPRLPLFSFNALYSGMKFVCINSTEYSAGEEVGPPQFTCDGSEVLFVGCTLDCFANVNGRRYPVYSGISPEKTFAMKPKSKTIAYTTSTSLVVKYLERNELVSGMMADYTSAPRYNWRTDSYEALGVINNKLYLMTVRI